MTVLMTCKIATVAQQRTVFWVQVRSSTS
ncbi:hypothetical protein cypCar_00008297, partial [Cyprinus carpio]